MKRSHACFWTTGTASSSSKLCLGVPSIARASGVSEPSEADRQLTQRLKTALSLVDIRVLNHFIVGDGAPLSFAERGMM